MPADASPAEPLTLDAPAVATLLGMSVQTINTWAKNDTMPAYRVGRSWIFLRQELLAWLDSTSTVPTDQKAAPSLADQLAPLPALLLVSEAAAVLQVSTSTISTMITNHQLGAHNLGTTQRVPVSAVRDYLGAVRNNSAF